MLKDKKIFATPKVRKFARELGANIRLIEGSERKGRISEEDVLYFPPLFDLQKPNIYNITSGKSISNVKPMQINLIDLLNQDGYKTNGIKCGGELELNQ